MFFKFSMALVFVAVIGATVVALPRDDGHASAADVEEAARYWEDVGTVQPARFDEGEWEVDVLRPNGSLVELTFNGQLELRDFDEELGAGGTWAHDEIRGPLRHRAILAALRETGPGRVPSVERDSRDEIEVNVRRGDATQIEVMLNAELRVKQVRREDPGDE